MEGTRGSTTLRVFVVALILSSGRSFAIADEDTTLSKPLKFTYYLHDNFVPPDTTAVQVASANGTFTGSNAFGDVSVFDSILRKGIKRNSTLIGGAGGEVVALKNLNFITFGHTLNIPKYAGTLSGAGRFNASAPSWEIGITGGTGFFRGATGYYTVRIADPDPLGFIFEYAATVLLPKWSTRKEDLASHCSIELGSGDSSI